MLSSNNCPFLNFTRLILTSTMFFRVSSAAPVLDHPYSILDHLHILLEEKLPSVNTNHSYFNRISALSFLVRHIWTKGKWEGEEGLWFAAHGIGCPRIADWVVEFCTDFTVCCAGLRCANLHIVLWRPHSTLCSVQPRVMWCYLLWASWKLYYMSQWIEIHRPHQHYR